jgi:hypothetical protein
LDFAHTPQNNGTLEVITLLLSQLLTFVWEETTPRSVSDMHKQFLLVFFGLDQCFYCVTIKSQRQETAEADGTVKSYYWVRSPSPNVSWRHTNEINQSSILSCYRVSHYIQFLTIKLPTISIAEVHLNFLEQKET